LATDRQTNRQTNR